VTAILVAVALAAGALAAGAHPNAVIPCAGTSAFFFGTALLLAYLSRDTNLWVEVDGGVVRAKSLYTFLVTARRVDEVREVSIIFFPASEVAIAAVRVPGVLPESVQGIEIKFPKRRRGFRVVRPEMTNVKELIEAVFAAMSERGRLVPEIINREGPPLIRRVTWER
jgi:hypothetical protein